MNFPYNFDSGDGILQEFLEILGSGNADMKFHKYSLVLDADEPPHTLISY